MNRSTDFMRRRRPSAGVVSRGPHVRERFVSRLTRRPFRAAIGTFAGGSLLVLVTAIAVRSLPVPPNLADESRETVSARALNDDSVSQPVAHLSAAAEDLHVATPSPAWSAPTAATAKGDVIFRNASLSNGSTAREPLIRIGPLIFGSPSTPVGKAGAAALSASTSKVGTTSSGGATITRVYRPACVTAKDLEPLLRPLLTPGVGTLIARSLAGDDGGKESGKRNASHATRDVVVVRDRPEIVQQIDALVRDLDAPPKRVAIDAVLLELTLNGSSPRSLDFHSSRTELVPGSPRDLIAAMQKAGQVSVLATNHLELIDREWGELQWASRADDSQSGNTNRVAVATSDIARTAVKIRVRPVVLAGGQVRLEVHPDFSRSQRRSRAEHLELETLTFTTDLVLHEGVTCVIDGFADERPANTVILPSPAEVPRIEPQTTVRQETKLLMMPRIVADFRVPDRTAAAR